MSEWLPSDTLHLRNGRTLPVEFTVSARAKRMRLVLTEEDRVRLTLPSGLFPEQAQEFLVSSIPWLERMIAQRERIRTEVPPEERGCPGRRSHCFYPREFIFPAFSQKWEIFYSFRDVCWCGVREESEGKLLVSGCVTDPHQVCGALLSYLKRKGTLLFDSMLQQLSAECRIPFSKFTVRTQKGRWGSCSSRGNISLNGSMLFFPEEALRYVMIHELCHLRHMDHSVRFWNEVERYCPDHRRIRFQIRKGFPSMWKAPEFIV